MHAIRLKILHPDLYQPMKPLTDWYPLQTVISGTPTPSRGTSTLSPGTSPSSPRTSPSSPRTSTSSPGTDPVICRGGCGDRWPGRCPAVTWLAWCQRVRGSVRWYKSGPQARDFPLEQTWCQADSLSGLRGSHARRDPSRSIRRCATSTARCGGNPAGGGHLGRSDRAFAALAVPIRVTRWSGAAQLPDSGKGDAGEP